MAIGNLFHAASRTLSSPYDILCNSGGCLTMVDDTADTITAWDYGHLTTAGSIYVVSSFKE